MREIDPLRPEDPERIGDYRLAGRLGEGGQGVVFRAADRDGTPVAVKLLHARLVHDPAARARLRDEIALVRRVADFCTAKVLDFGTAGDRPYIVSEYVDGPPLQTLVDSEGPLSDGALARLMVGTASALAATHQAGVLHQDLTPHNILMGPDGPRVIDFGVARALDSAAAVTSGIVGTPAYLAPEQLRGGHQPGPAADMFSWAVTMTFAATGRPAFGAESVSVVFERILNGEPAIDEVPWPYRDVIARCLAKDPIRRPGAREALLRLLGHEEAGAAASGLGAPKDLLRSDRLTVDRPAGPAPHAVDPAAGRPAGRRDADATGRPDGRPGRWRRRRGELLVACAVVAGILGASGLTFLRPGGGPEHRAAPVAVSTVTVGAANFPESRLLGEIYAEALESRGLKVIRRFDLGDRETYLRQVESGQVQVMPEYNGALAAALDPAAQPARTAEINAVLRRELPARLEILASAQAEDKDSVTVTRKTAERYHLRGIADLRPVAGRLVMGGSPEFQTRHQGLVGLRGVYGLNFMSYQPFQTGDRETMIRQLKDGVIQAANLFTTDPAIAENDFVVLRDPENLFSAQNVTPLVYRGALNAAGRSALDAVSTRLTTADLLAMNTKVSVNRLDVTVVAKDWLLRAGVVA